jgi:hypothetical protein
MLGDFPLVIGSVPQKRGEIAASIPPIMILSIFRLRSCRTRSLVSGPQTLCGATTIVLPSSMYGLKRSSQSAPDCLRPSRSKIPFREKKPDVASIVSGRCANNQKKFGSATVLLRSSHDEQWMTREGGAGFWWILPSNILALRYSERSDGTGWFTKILTDPFHDVKMYHMAPIWFLRGQ